MMKEKQAAPWDFARENSTLDNDVVVTVERGVDGREVGEADFRSDWHTSCRWLGSLLLKVQLFPDL